MKKTIGQLTTIIILLTTSSSVGQVAKIDNWEVAQEKALSQKKSILIILTGEEWCRPCMKMERDVINHPEFISFANTRLVIFEINLPKPIELNSSVYKMYRVFSEKYQTNALPSLILTDHTGLEKVIITNATGSATKVVKRLNDHL